MSLTKFLVGLCVISSSCKPTKEISLAGYILGPTNDIAPASTHDDAEFNIPNTVKNAAVLIATSIAGGKVKFCSGIIIASETKGSYPRVLTNHHCFAKSDDRGMALEGLVKEACRDTTVYFGFVDKAKAPIKKVDCKPGSLRTHYASDLAIFALADDLPENTEPIKISAKAYAANREAYIIHYPDIPENLVIPPGETVQLPVASITDNDCATKGWFPEDEWKLDRALPYSIRHTCDLLHGSSGSALLDKSTHQLLGINWGGIKIKYANEVDSVNAATSVNYVSAFIDERLDVLEKPIPDPNATPTKSRAALDAENAAAETRQHRRGMDIIKCGTLVENSSPTQKLVTAFGLLLPALFIFTYSRMWKHEL